MARGPQRTDLFALPIIETDPLPGFESHRDALVDLALACRGEVQGGDQSNQNGFSSRQDVHERDDTHLKWLLEHIHEALLSAQATIPNGLRRGVPHVAHMWFNVHGRGGYNIPHSHAPNFWSGVFYLRAEASREGVGPDELDGSICFHNPHPRTATYGAAPEVRVSPRDGTMVLFPSFLVHTVLPHRADHVRISMAFNANLRKGGTSC